MSRRNDDDGDDGQWSPQEHLQQLGQQYGQQYEYQEQPDYAGYQTYHYDHTPQTLESFDLDSVMSQQPMQAGSPSNHGSQQQQQLHLQQRQQQRQRQLEASRVQTQAQAQAQASTQSAPATQSSQSSAWPPPKSSSSGFLSNLFRRKTLPRSGSSGSNANPSPSTDANASSSTSRTSRQFHGSNPLGSPLAASEWSMSHHDGTTDDLPTSPDTDPNLDDAPYPQFSRRQGQSQNQHQHQQHQRYPSFDQHASTSGSAAWLANTLSRNSESSIASTSTSVGNSANDIATSGAAGSGFASLLSLAPGNGGGNGGGSSGGGGASPMKLLNRIRNLRSTGITKDYWMRDEKVKECYDCKQPFTTFRRRHHCRICGQIFCRKCASSIVPGERFGVGAIRVCNFCLKIMDDFRREGPLQPDPATVSIMSNSSSHATFATPMHQPLGGRSPSYATLPLPSPAPAAMSRRISTPISITESPEPGGPDSLRKAGSSSLFWRQQEDSLSLADQQDMDASGRGVPFRRGLDGTSALGTDLAERPAPLGESVPEADGFAYNTDDEVDSVGYLSQGWVPAAFAPDTIGSSMGYHVSRSGLDGEYLTLNQGRASFVPDAVETWRQGHAQVHGSIGSTPMKRRSYAGSYGGPRYPPPRSSRPAITPQTFFPPQPLPSPLHHGASGTLSGDVVNSILSGQTTLEDPVMPYTSTVMTDAMAMAVSTIAFGDADGVAEQGAGDLDAAMATVDQGAGEAPAMAVEADSMPDGSVSAAPSDSNDQSGSTTVSTKGVVGSLNLGLNAASFEHLRRILIQTLMDHQVEQSDEWAPAIMGMLLNTVSLLRPELSGYNYSMDFCGCVKIKKIPGGAIADSEYITGVVCTKNAIHKNMLRVISNPRIMIVTFAIEYQRVENQLVSLEALMTQEHDHLHNMVKRILALEPDVVLVERTVARVALELLLDAGVVVAQSVKMDALIHISRCTNADIIQSVDRFALKPQLGTCKSFTFKTYLNLDIPGLRKTFMFFEGCTPALGATLVLRGAEMDQLMRVKKVVYFMLPIANSLRLETSLLRDMYAVTPRIEPEAEGLRSLVTGTMGPSPTPLPQAIMGGSVFSTVGQTREEESEIARLIRRFEHTILSGSPCVKFPVPYTLVKMREKEVRTRAAVAAARRRPPLMHSMSEPRFRSETPSQMATLVQSPQQQPQQITQAPTMYQQTMPDASHSLPMFTSQPQQLLAQTDGSQLPPQLQSQSNASLPLNQGTPLSQAQSLSVAPSPLPGPSPNFSTIHLHNANAMASSDTPMSERSELPTLFSPGPSLYEPTGSVPAAPAGDEAALTAMPEPTRMYSGLLFPENQQSITVLYSNMSRSKSVPCVPPRLNTLLYYHDETDLPLGLYLQTLCSESEAMCPVKGCDSLLMLHSRIYVHHNGKLTVSVDALPCPIPGMEHRIIMWSLCKICRLGTPPIPMSEESWKYSFGKYLELAFYHTKLSCRAMDCSHDVYRDHIRYFSLRNLTVRFDYESIGLYQVSVPPIRRVPKYEVLTKLRAQDLDTLRGQIEAYCDSVIERISMFTYEIVPASRVQACKEAMAEYSKRAASDKKLLLQLLQQTSVSNSPDDLLAPNAVYQTLLAKVAQWDADFATFVRSFLQSDAAREGLRMAVQIKRMFADRDSILPDFKFGVPVVPVNQDSPQFDVDLEAAAALLINPAKLPMLSESPTPPPPPPVPPKAGAELAAAALGKVLDNVACQPADDKDSIGVGTTAIADAGMVAASATPVLALSTSPESVDVASSAADLLAGMPGSSNTNSTSTTSSSSNMASLSDSGLAVVSLMSLANAALTSSDTVPAALPTGIAPVEDTLQLAIASDADATDQPPGQLSTIATFLEGVSATTAAVADKNDVPLPQWWLRVNVLANDDSEVGQLSVPELCKSPSAPSPDKAIPTSDRGGYASPTGDRSMDEATETGRSVSRGDGHVDDVAADGGTATAASVPRSESGSRSGMASSALSSAVSVATPQQIAASGMAPARVISIAPATSGASAASDLSAAVTASAVYGQGSRAESEGRDDDVGLMESVDDGIMYPRHPSPMRPRLRVAAVPPSPSTSIGAANATTGSMTGNTGSANPGSASSESSLSAVRQKRQSIKAGQMLADEDEPSGEWNTITGVAAETVQPPPSQTSAAGPAVGERASIMKTITNLWNGNAANFLPLAYPSNPTEHVFPDSLIIVRESEPSSIIAFTLGSRHYKDKLVSLQASTKAVTVPSDLVQTAGPVVGSLSSNAGSASTGINLGAGGTAASAADEAAQVRYVVDADDQVGDADQLETVPGSTGPHIRMQVWDGPTRIHCKVFFAEQFEALRRSCGVDEMFVQSLARCVKWDASGGRSGSMFLKTRDDWLVVKQLSRAEKDALCKFAPHYFEHMTKAIFKDLPTILAKIFGFYRIGYKNPATGKTAKMELLVMENLFCNRSISRIFDLKGSSRNRHVQSTGRQNEVLMDENLLEFMYESPLYIREYCKGVLHRSIWNDTLFLSKYSVMDYSLIVGIDNDTDELVVGIVDFIRTFTWDKKLESWVKETGILGGGGKEPTIVTPRQYKSRFRQAMDRYFMIVPDKHHFVN
ncbi:hypothetical protein BC831DRAFT_459437 [Entophlyctis helioformis]|nr:hypothetical protein BC831DRAFT_459437 [Entophlyctis helioformis]